MSCRDIQILLIVGGFGLALCGCGTQQSSTGSEGSFTQSSSGGDMPRPDSVIPQDTLNILARSYSFTMKKNGVGQPFSVTLSFPKNEEAQLKMQSSGALGSIDKTLDVRLDSAVKNCSMCYGGTLYMFTTVKVTDPVLSANTFILHLSLITIGSNVYVVSPPQKPMYIDDCVTSLDLVCAQANPAVVFE